MSQQTYPLYATRKTLIRIPLDYLIETPLDQDAPTAEQIAEFREAAIDFLLDNELGPIETAPEGLDDFCVYVDGAVAGEQENKRARTEAARLALEAAEAELAKARAAYEEALADQDSED